jgi:hypothetical protein
MSSVFDETRADADEIAYGSKWILCDACRPFDGYEFRKAPRQRSGVPGSGNSMAHSWPEHWWEDLRNHAPQPDRKG